MGQEIDLSLDIETEKSSADTEVKMAQDLGKRILKTLNLPEDQYYRPFDFRWNRYETPIVSFEMEGGRQNMLTFSTQKYLLGTKK